jgi:hypothetical protein
MKEQQCTIKPSPDDQYNDVNATQHSYLGHKVLVGDLDAAQAIGSVEQLECTVHLFAQHKRSVVVVDTSSELVF